MAGVPRIMQSMFRTLEQRLPRGLPVVSRSVHAMPMLEGTIAEGLSAIQARFPTLDLGSYPFERDGRYGVSLVAKGTDAAAVTEAIKQARALIVAAGFMPIDGEPA